MAKREIGTKRTNDGTTTDASGAMAARGENRGRSGGVVDAPGKKHRKPMPTDPGANIADGKDDGEDEPATRPRLAHPFPKAVAGSPSYSSRRSHVDADLVREW